MSEETQVYENQNANGSDEKRQEFELYIKASVIDKESRGACPICHQWFLISYLLAENQVGVNFKVFTVQADCPPKNFFDEGWSKKFPVVKARQCVTKTGQEVTNMKYDTFEELESFFESINIECPELKRHNAPNVAAMKCIQDLYTNFNHFLQGKHVTKFEDNLAKLDEFLYSQDTKFLVDNVFTFSDCYLLPRLHHIRVAGEYYKDYSIPKRFGHIWKYLALAYEVPAFKSTLPSDEDIILAYEKKASTDKKRKPILRELTHTTTVPAEYLENNDANQEY